MNTPTQPDDPLIGQRLSNFRIERLIERGGMASVYYGWDAKLERPVAIKVIDSLHQDVAYAKRLVQEARIIAKWRHENIVQVYYADQKDRLYFFAMEYVDGMDLGTLMAHYVSLGELIPHADVIRIARAIASALDFAHRRGVIHRDVKPSNVMLAEDGRVVLTDFGLALDVRQGTVGEVLGTPHYIAPEQALDSAKATSQSDLYSLGVILYEMLTGSVPFDDPSPMSVAVKHMTEEPPLPTHINPALSIPVEAVLLKALSKAPDDRYPSSEVLVDALETALSHPAPGIGADAANRLRTPVADVLTAQMMGRATLPARGEKATEQPLPVTMLHARRKAARQRWVGWWIAVGVAVALVLVVIATLAVLGLPMLTSTATPGDLTVQTQAAEGVSPVPPQEVNPSPAVTAVQTESPAETGVSTPVPAQPTPLTSEVPAVSGGYKIVLFYTDHGFYLWNVGDRVLDPRGFAFEALDSASGAATNYRFNGGAWYELHFTLDHGWCDIIEVLGTSAYRTRPRECNSFNAQTTPLDSSTELFWIARPGISDFHVLWNKQEIGRCEIGTGQCEVYLPFP